MKKPEILAPAGSMDALKAAVHAGADAIYLGGSRYGARAYAGNFDKEELISGLEYAHLYGVKVYLTVNTLFRNEEVEQLYDYLLPYYQAGLDAVIVQDIGVMWYIHVHFPELAIHASTQMTITTPYAYSLLKEYGVTRIVPARELSLEEIKALKGVDDTPEVEVFVQGALCYCYSGQCLMSSMLGGRSGNRGRCAQSCRLPYTLYDEAGNRISGQGRYLLSPKDLCELEQIPQLVRAGVDSFKIEGRMKKPEYVAACVRAYRMCLDAWWEQKEVPYAYYREQMAEIFNRGGFTDGYLYRKNGKDMMTIAAPGHSGVVVGTVTEIRKNQIQVQLCKDVNKGDIFVVETKGSPVTLTCPENGVKGNRIFLNVARAKEFVVDSSLCRMFHQPLTEELKTYYETDKKIPLLGKVVLKAGQPAQLSLSMQQEKYNITVYGEEVQCADRKALTEETVRSKIASLGTTKYYFEDCIFLVQEGIFYPLKALKDLRRNAIAALEEQVCLSYERALPEEKDMGTVRQQHYEPERELRVMVSNAEQLELARQYPEISRIYVDMQFFRTEEITALMEQYPEYGYVLPPVLRTNVLKELCRLPLVDCHVLVVRCLDELAYLKQIGYSGKVVVDYSLYAMNDYAAAWLRGQFPQVELTIPVELNRRQAKHMSDSEQIVYGYQPLMISAQCLTETMTGCSGKMEKYVLKDRLNKSFFTTAVCKYCYHIIYNGVPLVLSFEEAVSPLVRLHFTKESKSLMKQVLDAFLQKELPGGEKTKGHYNRGVE